MAYSLRSDGSLSALEAYLRAGHTMLSLQALAVGEDIRLRAGPKTYRREPGDIFRIAVPSAFSHETYMIRTLKVSDTEFRFGHSVEELEALKILKRIL